MKKYSEILLNTFFENTMQNEFLLMPTALFTIKEFSAFFKLLYYPLNYKVTDLCYAINNVLDV